MAPTTKGSPGYSLVEFLVAMLILALVSLSWLTIIQVQSANRESYRREAVERLAGMMDVISMYGLAGNGFKAGTAWAFEDGNLISLADGKAVKPIFDPVESSIGYRLRIKKASEVNDLISYGNISEKNSEESLLPATGASPVLVGELFEQSGTLEKDDYEGNERSNLGKRIWRVVVVLRLS